MANETNISGVIEFYRQDDFDRLYEFINGLGEENFFNLSIHSNFLHNRGSILVPFAKCFRSDADDHEFLLGKLKNLASDFSFIEMFAVELYAESPVFGHRHYLFVKGTGNDEIEQFDMVLNKI